MHKCTLNPHGRFGRIWDFVTLFALFSSGAGASSQLELRPLLDDEIWDDFTKRRKLEREINTLEEADLSQVADEVHQRGLVSLFKARGLVDEEDEPEMIEALLSRTQGSRST